MKVKLCLASVSPNRALPSLPPLYAAYLMLVQLGQGYWIDALDLSPTPGFSSPAVINHNNGCMCSGGLPPPHNTLKLAGKGQQLVASPPAVISLENQTQLDLVMRQVPPPP